MSERAEALAARFELVAREFTEFVEGLDDEQWRLVGKNHPTIRQPNAEDEGRPVGVIAYHTAASMQRQPGRLGKIARGEPPDPLPAPGTNEVQAREHADASREEVLQLLRESAPPLAAFIRGLSDEQLERRGAMVFGEGSVGEAIERVAIGHILWHQGSIEATIAPTL